MALLKGNGKIVINASTTAAVVADMADWSLDLTRAVQDAGTFDDGEWSKSFFNKISWSGSFNGYIASLDTTGQDVLQAAFLAGTTVSDIRFYVDYSTTSSDTVEYWVPDFVTDSESGILISSWNIKKDQANKVTNLTCSFTGTGIIKQVRATLP